MQWLPPAPQFRDSLRAASSAASPAERIAQLIALSQHRLSYLEVIQLDRALGQSAATSSLGLSAVKMALLASSTVDHLLPGIRVGALRRHLLVEPHIGSYGQYRQELLDPQSPLHAFKPQVVLFALSARHTIASIPVTASFEEADRALDRSIADLQTLWRAARSSLHATVVQQTFLNVAEPIFGSHEPLVAGAPARLIRRLNDKLIDAARADGIVLLDIAGASERDGLDAWFDATRWLQAKMEISPAAVPLYGELLARVLAAQRGLSKKCLVLDLDNTLWGGVIGDDGIEGIVLGEGSALGEAHVALQRYVQLLARRGVILAVCSKNDLAIAEQAFSTHPEMVLKRSDIACFIANWEPKAGNLQTIARQLNIGLDSLVFLDDNPVERAAIRAALPMVAVPELPADPAHYVRCLAAAGYFEATTFTVEDQQRSEQYAANASRDAVMQSAGNLEGFLAGLQMSTVYGRVRDVDLTRVTQLINKTNQFNLTTRRSSLEEVTAFANDPDGAVLQFRLIDRFGDNGLVSVMVLRPSPSDRAVLDVETWVMSCRVFGRQLEFEAMNVAVETAVQLGARELQARYIPTPKNDVVKNLYAELGFTPVTHDLSSDGATTWRLPLVHYQARHTSIARSPL